MSMSKSSGHSSGHKENEPGNSTQPQSGGGKVRKPLESDKLTDNAALKRTANRFITYLEWDSVASGLPGFTKEKTHKQHSTKIDLDAWTFI